MSFLWKMLPGASTAINFTTALSFYRAGNYPSAVLYLVGCLPLPFSGWIGFITGTGAKATEAGSLLNRLLHMVLTVLGNPQHIISAASVLLWLSARLQFIPGMTVIGQISSEVVIKMSAVISGIFGAADHALRKVEWTKTDQGPARASGKASGSTHTPRAPPRANNPKAPVH